MNPRFGCVVLKAQECNWQNAHVTMFFAGEIDKYSPEIKDQILELLFAHFKGITYLGYPVGYGSWKVSNKTTAFPLQDDKLLKLHTILKNLFKTNLGLLHESKFPFNPHISTPNNKELPICIDLTPLQLWWGGNIYDIS